MASPMVRKLIVEVVEARDLLPKDGSGTSSPYVVIDFDGQRRRTQVIHRDLNPKWNEALEFKLNKLITPILDMSTISGRSGGDPLQVVVFHDKRVGHSRRNHFLGRVRIDPRHFVRKGEEALEYFPLEKKNFLSWVRGYIGLRIYYVDEPVVVVDPVSPPEAPAPEFAGSVEEQPAATTAETTKQEAEQPEAVESEGCQPETQPISPATQEEWQPETEPIPSATQEENSQIPQAEEERTSENFSASTETPWETTTNTYQPQPQPMGSTAEREELQPQSKPETLELEKLESSPRLIPQPEPRPVPVVERTPEPVERSSYDLVDKMHYLFVRVVRGRSLPSHAKPHVRIEGLGRHISTTTARRGAFFEWDQTFAFSRQPSTAAADSSTLEISVWDLPLGSNITTAAASDNHFLGGVCFDVSDVPTRDPPDSSLAPQWYRLEGSGGRNGDLMLATWVGTLADESFAEAVKVDHVKESRISSSSKVYVSPKLWYLRATVIEANDTFTAIRDTGISVEAVFGFQMLTTRSTSSRNGAPSWNEDLTFVTAEPFSDDKLTFTLEIRHGKDKIRIGSADVEISSIERRVDDRKVTSRWLDFTPTGDIKRGKKGTSSAWGGRLHVRVCLDGGYHVADEPPQSASDFRPSARQLWRHPIGVVELGIISCKNLLPMTTIDGKGSTDAYVVAKYGPKWARTRTIPDSFDPSWNEQYTWPVDDPCTVLTVGVFHESDASKESVLHPMGKIRIRISTLETNRDYRCVYPLILLVPSGAKKMGEVEVAIRFSCAVSSLDLLHVYSQPMLPVMHYIHPISAAQGDPLRLHAARIVATHLSQSEPALKKEAAMWMLDASDPRGFSMRKMRANYYRIVSSLSWVVDMVKWVEDTRTWRNPSATMIAHVVMILLVWFPELVVPTLALHLFGTGLWRYRYRVSIPAADPSIRISGADAVDRDDLDEEFDPIPSARGVEAVRPRYDRARAIGARVQALLGDVAAQTERMQALVTWRDPRATGMFVGLCLVVAVILYVVPSKAVAILAGLYWLRHPMFRNRMPTTALNFFRRLPALSDRII